MAHNQPAGVFNFREVGGYAGHDGKRVRSGLLYRSDDLSELDDTGVQYLADMKLRAVIDFRDAQEAATAPDRLPASLPRPHRYHLPIEAGKLVGGGITGRISRERAIAVMASVYRSLIDDFTGIWSEFFQILLRPEHHPLIYHCTAGKDRTGVATALFLLAMGVDRQTIMADYLESRERMKNKYLVGIDFDSGLEPFFTVYPEFLEAAFSRLDHAGGAETYLQQRVGVDTEVLRSLYLE